MNAIVTKFLGPTDYRGSRIKATADGWQPVTLDYDHALEEGGNHARAAKALRDAQPRCVGLPMIGGTLPSGDMVWLFVKGAPKLD